MALDPDSFSGAVAAEKLGETRAAWRLGFGMEGIVEGAGGGGAGTLCCGCFEDSLSQKSCPEDWCRLPLQTGRCSGEV